MAYNCNISTAQGLACRDSQGGVASVYFLVGGIDSIETDADGAITGMTADDATTDTFYQWKTPRQTSSYSETINASTENGTLFFEQSLELVINGLTAKRQSEIKLLASNPELRVVVSTAAGQLFLLGKEYGVAVSAGTSGTGTSAGDRVGTTLTFTGQEPSPASILVGNFVAEGTLWNGQIEYPESE
jgi:hypothetical protein